MTQIPNTPDQYYPPTTNAPAPVDHTPPVALPGRVGQGTAVEQTRAIAEVQAAIVSAQQCPRRIDVARNEMRLACSMYGMAEQAFYRYSRGGSNISGTTVHLARELARCFGNVQYGISELRRDDEYGQSEMNAWAWDVQMNTRASNTFIVPHLRDKKGGAVKLTDQRDIYENNANQGSRRLREAINAILPKWFTEEAREICEATLKKGDGTKLSDRIEGAIAAFAGIDIPESRLVQKLGRPSEKWTAFDIAQLMISYKSIQRGEIPIDDEFPQPRVTAEEITAPAATENGKATKKAAARKAGPLAADDPPPNPTDQGQLVDSGGKTYAPDDPGRPM